MNVFYDKAYRAISNIGLTDEAVKTYADIIATEYEEQKMEECRKKFYMFKQAINDIDPDDMHKFINYVPKEFESIKAVYNAVFEKQTPHLLEIIKEKFESELDLEYEDGLGGYRLTKYRNLANKLDGIKAGLHIIAADPNVGKTALSCSVAIDLLESSSLPNVHFYTIDDPKNSILNRFLAIMSQRSMNIVNRKRNPADSDAVRIAYNKLIGFAANERLKVYDSSDFNSNVQLEAHIRRSRNEKENLVVFVDGTTNLSLEGKSDDYHTDLALMFKELWKPTADGLKEIPLIITNELKKRESDRKPIGSDIKGSRKWEYVADSILLLYAQDREAFNNKQNMNVVIDLFKNKFSDKRGTYEMHFKPEISCFNEILYGEV